MKFLSDFVISGVCFNHLSETLFLFLRPRHLHFVAFNPISCLVKKAAPYFDKRPVSFNFCVPFRSRAMAMSSFMALTRTLGVPRPISRASSRKLKRLVRAFAAARLHPWSMRGSLLRLQPECYKPADDF